MGSLLLVEKVRCRVVALKADLVILLLKEIAL